MARAYRTRGTPITLEWMRSHCIENEETGCWEWMLSCNTKGYGQVNRGGNMHRTHRVAFELSQGAIPHGKLVMHRCDNRRCCNPEHLSVGTPLANTQDMIQKGRAQFGTNPARGEQHPSAKLQDAQALEIYNASGSTTEIAKAFGVSRRTISFIKSGHTWRHVTNEPSKLAA